MAQWPNDTRRHIGNAAICEPVEAQRKTFRADVFIGTIVPALVWYYKSAAFVNAIDQWGD